MGRVTGCVVCGRKFEPTASGQVTCSWMCTDERQQGADQARVRRRYHDPQIREKLIERRRDSADPQKVQQRKRERLLARKAERAELESQAEQLIADFYEEIWGSNDD